MDKIDLAWANTTVERAAKNGSLTVPSKQAPYIGEASGGFFSSVLDWEDIPTPPYIPNSRKRDEWLLNFVHQEPHLEGVLNTACSLVANRGWRLIGGRNLVNRTRMVMHDADRSEGARFGKGWRHFIRNSSKAFYNADISSITEVGREGDAVEEGITGPMRAIWSTDPTRFLLTGKTDFPLKYYPSSGDQQEWTDSDYFRITANKNLLEKYFGLGYCAISMCIELAKILIAVYRYDQEQLGARAPKGLLLLQGITQRQWNEAMKKRKEKLDGMEREYYGGIAVLASLGQMTPDAKIVALSELPAEFDRTNFITLLMYLYSLSFGFSPDEFWPVQVGWLLGRNTEAELGLERATQKGDADFFLAFQDRFQMELPHMPTGDPSVLFQFEERNDRGRQANADVTWTWSRSVALLYEAGLKEGVPLLTKEQAQRLLVDQGILPAEYTEFEEDAQAFDTHAVRMADIARSTEGVRDFAKQYPSEPIVLYTYEWPNQRTRVLYSDGQDMLKQRVYPVQLPMGM